MDTHLSSVCSIFQRQIEATKREIERKRNRMQRIATLIAEMSSNPNPDTAAINNLQEEKKLIEIELENDGNALAVLEEEFTMHC
ncbi:hypothetical protein [Inquilinus sp. CA228]|uniref:hypothetical protein n=1 Tax=Inquilinus sp. CA228 TaxID=3455609 RepID=UPI003F8CF9FB